MDSKKVESYQQQDSPQYEEVHAARAVIDQVCEDATLKGPELTPYSPNLPRPLQLTRV
jgi:hypothetical protein